jgi:hypothetical protein
MLATHLRRIMLEELQRRNYSDGTIRRYLHAVEGQTVGSIFLDDTCTE